MTVYQIVCKFDPNVKYIGSTNRPIKTRLSEHIYSYNKAVRRGDNITRKLFLAFNQYGVDSFTIEPMMTIADCDSRFLLRMEDTMIRKHEPCLNHKRAYESTADKIERMRQYRKNQDRQKVRDYHLKYYLKHRNIQHKRRLKYPLGA